MANLLSIDCRKKNDICGFFGYIYLVLTVIIVAKNIFILIYYSTFKIHTLLYCNIGIQYIEMEQMLGVQGKFKKN